MAKCELAQSTKGPSHEGTSGTAQFETLGEALAALLAAAQELVGSASGFAGTTLSDYPLVALGLILVLLAVLFVLPR